MSFRNWLFIVGLTFVGVAGAQTQTQTQTQTQPEPRGAGAAAATQAAAGTQAATGNQAPARTGGMPVTPAGTQAGAATGAVAGTPGAVTTPVVPAVPVPAVGTAPECPKPADFKQVRIQSVAATPTAPLDNGAPAAATSGNAVVRLRQGISVRVKNLQFLQQQAACERKNIVLYLENRQLQDLQPYPQSDPNGDVLYFELKRTEASREVWTYLLGKPRFRPRHVPVSVGIEGGYALPSEATVAPAIRLEVIPTGWLSIWAAVMAVLLYSGVRLARESDMLRDTGPSPDAKLRKAYSLARVQLAAWTFLILASYLFIGLITGDYTTSITDSVLALMGISVGTTIGSSIIDNNPTRTSAAAAAAPAAPVVAGAGGAPVVAGGAVAPAATTATATTGHWWKDILMDQDGVNFHRFQMAAWTFVLGIVFLRQVYNELAMPEFNANLLALIGISSGTYLGLKITSEK